MMEKVMQLSREKFMEVYGDVFEGTPWLAERVWETALDQQPSARRLHYVFEHFIRPASDEEKLALLQNHPPLAVATKRQKDLSTDSQMEQRSAGLDRCTPEEFAEFEDLNARYLEKFGFPFIIAVKGLDPYRILEIFRERISNNREEEFETAIEQVIRIGWFRIEDRFEEIV